MSKYIYIELHIVGGGEREFETVYDSDYHESHTLEAAIKHGLKTLDHDDFWVGEMKDGKLSKIYHSDGTPREFDKEEFLAAQEAL